MMSTLRIVVRCILAGVVLVIPPSATFAQFSPGDLSRVHHELEGTQQCVRCHEVGKEISGAKCLSCHQPIQDRLARRRGFHGRTADQPCVTCHKEHLGLDARTMKFDSTSFDHTQTGFPLSGRHQQTACQACHRNQLIRDTSVIRSLASSSRMTYLGLDTACATCHRDPHKGAFKQSCSSCHSTAGWKSIHGFDHATTSFPLTGKHTTVSCSKCHTSMNEGQPSQKVNFSTKSFSDCTPCHASPHGRKFEGKRCSSCHTPGAWTGVSTTSFDHNLTSYPLKGKHQSVQCASCHRQSDGKAFKDVFRMAHDRCTDCHKDAHGGVFLKTYANDCAVCHTVAGFTPSTVTIAQHQKFSFVLTGSHLALPCNQCHTTGDQGSRFRFSSLRCSACHTDVHKGQFDTAMKTASCAACHGTSGWKPATYDHAVTGFTLDGRHALAKCASCHKELAGTPGRNMKFARLRRDCQACHTDPHAGQFAAEGSTDCASCHTAQDWKARGFNHERASRFPLTGAHVNVRCAACHQKEDIGGGPIVRYKPLSPACSSCHKGRDQRQ